MIILLVSLAVYALSAVAFALVTAASKLAREVDYRD
jgi:hypothetical protein